MGFSSARTQEKWEQYFTALGAVVVLLLIGAFLLGGPILSIWAINGLVGIEIPVTFKTWICSFWLFAGPELLRLRKSKS